MTTTSRASGGDTTGDPLTEQELIGLMRFVDGPDRMVDGEIFRLVEGKPGDVWVKISDDDVWHRQDPDDKCAWDPPPYYTESVDAALSLINFSAGWLPEIHYSDNFAGPSWEVDFGNMVYDATEYHRHRHLAVAICMAAMDARDLLRCVDHQTGAATSAAD